MRNIPLLTIMVCTRNRGAALAATLDSISEAARTGPFYIEAVIVDNGSTDDTPAVIERWARAQAFPVKKVVESQPGLARARNSGLRHVCAPVICMTDDDCTLNSDYFEKVLAAFSKENGAAIIGGRIELGDEDDLPITIKTSMKAETLDPRRFPGGFIMGANLALSAEALTRVGEFDIRYGAGASFIAAEDTDFLVRAMDLNIPIRYDPTFSVNHFHGRRDIGQAISLLKGYNFGDGALYAKHFLHNSKIRQAIISSLRSAVREQFRPSATQLGIRRFNTFKLVHRVRGMVAYYRETSISQDAN